MLLLRLVFSNSPPPGCTNLVRLANMMRNAIPAKNIQKEDEGFHVRLADAVVNAYTISVWVVVRSSDVRRVCRVIHVASGFLGLCVCKCVCVCVCVQRARMMGLWVFTAVAASLRCRANAGCEADCGCRLVWVGVVFSAVVSANEHADPRSRIVGRMEVHKRNADITLGLLVWVGLGYVGLVCMCCALRVQDVRQKAILDCLGTEKIKGTGQRDRSIEQMSVAEE